MIDFRRWWKSARVLQALAATFCSLIVTTAAHAKPEYAAREMKACQYCHVSASPGLIDPKTREREPFTRNNRGIYYGEHNHSFTGYVERRVMGVSAPPVFHFGWRETLTNAPRRIAVADVTGDGKPRLILLNEKAGNKTERQLTVQKWDGKAFVTEFTGDVHAVSDRLEVGKYAGADRPPVILTEDAAWYWDGKTYTRVESRRPLALFGTTKLRDGSERVLIADKPTEVKAYRVDVKADGGNLLKDGTDAPTSAQYSFVEMHATPFFFDQMNIPPVLAQGGVIGVWDVRKFGKMFLYHARINQDFDIKNDPGATQKSQFVLKNQSWCVEFVDPNDTSQADVAKRGPVGLYFTPTLAGAIFDIATESAKGDGAPGLLVLTSDAPDGKGRSLYFFPLD